MQSWTKRPLSSACALQPHRPRIIYKNPALFIKFLSGALAREYGLHLKLLVMRPWTSDFSASVIFHFEIRIRDKLRNKIRPLYMRPLFYSNCRCKNISSSLRGKLFARRGASGKSRTGIDTAIYRGPDIGYGANFENIFLGKNNILLGWKYVC